MKLMLLEWSIRHHYEMDRREENQWNCLISQIVLDHPEKWDISIVMDEQLSKVMPQAKWTTVPFPRSSADSIEERERSSSMKNAVQAMDVEYNGMLYWRLDPALARTKNGDVERDLEWSRVLALVEDIGWNPIRSWREILREEAKDCPFLLD